MASDTEDPHFGFYDEFEEQMDNFWKDENPNAEEAEEIENFFDDEDEEDNEGGGIEGLEEMNEEEMEAILAEEEEELLKESGLEEVLKKEEEKPEKIILDRLNLDKLINMLSKVRLAWPEDLPGFDENEFATDAERAKFRESFYHCTDKEKTVLWHAENFRRQYQNEFPKRRALVIAPINECGCQKLFSTFINPCILGYAEFIDCSSCSRFLKDYLAPEIMPFPPRVPDRIRSHVTVLKKRNANCYEFAVILATFLIGAGYDAYVVDGYASKTICTMDATKDYSEEPEEPEEMVKKDKKAIQGKAPEKSAFDFMKMFGKDEEEEKVRDVSPSKYRFKNINQEVIVNPEEEEEDEPILELDDLPIDDIDKEEEEEDEGEGEDEEGDDEEEEEGEGKEEQDIEEMEEEMNDVEVEEIEGEGAAKEADENYRKEMGELVRIAQEEYNLAQHAEEMGEWDGENDLEEYNGEGEEEEEEEMEAVVKVKRVKPSRLQDPFYAMRTHAWILLLPGSRDVKEAFFIDPFSGCKFSLEDENFQAIETVFNHKNFYVNLQDCDYGLHEISYDLNDPSKWSKFLYETEKRKKTNQEEASLFQDEEDDTPKKAELLLDMPTSWTPDPDISQEDYERKYPGGKKTFNYNDAIVELAAPYVNDDGMVKKVLKFNGPGRNPEDLVYIEEVFENRKDKLLKRKWFRAGRLLHEFFDKGRRDALKEHVHISGKNNPSYPRDLYYYANAHPQSVAHRQILRKKMIEHFEERDDLLYYRLTSFGGVLCDMDSIRPENEPPSQSKVKEFLEMLKGDNSGAGGKKRKKRKIIKIVEKYSRDDSKTFDEDISEKHMLIEDGQLKILFHYGKGNLTRNSLEFSKPKGSHMDSTEFKPEDCIEYQADKLSPPMNVYRKFKLLQRMEADQRVAMVLAVQAEDEVFQTVMARVQEDWRHEIEPDAFAGDRNEEYIRMKEQRVVEDEEEEEDLTGVDFTTPFFEKFGVPKNKAEEVLMKKRIMLHAKVRIVRKAHAIQESYEREASHLGEKMKWHDNHIEKMTPSQEEDFEHMYRERLFEMHIMQKRLTKHQELASSKFYETLVNVLKHPQLNKFSNKKIPPPEPVSDELSEEEKARLAREAAKAKDCCQFYTVKYAEPKKEERRKSIAADAAATTPVEDKPPTGAEDVGQPPQEPPATAAAVAVGAGDR